MAADVADTAHDMATDAFDTITDMGMGIADTASDLATDVVDTATNVAADVVDTATDTIIKRVGPINKMIWPHTVNGRQTLSFVNVDHIVGFEICDLRTGKKLKTEVTSAGTRTKPSRRFGSRSVGKIATIVGTAILVLIMIGITIAVAKGVVSAW